MEIGDFRHMSHSVASHQCDRRDPMRLGYARTSTADQKNGIEAQITELQRQGCDKIFSETVSSVARRDQLEAALDYLRDGDTLVVTRLDRLARSVPNLLDIVDRVKARQAMLEWEAHKHSTRP